MIGRDKTDKYDDNIAVPFFPREWLNWFTGIFVVIIVGILALKYGAGMKPLGNISGTFLGDVSVLTTVGFCLAFVLGRVRSWNSNEDRNKGLDDFDELIESNTDLNLTDTQKHGIRQIVEECKK